VGILDFGLQIAGLRAIANRQSQMPLASRLDFRIGVLGVRRSFETVHRDLLAGPLTFSPEPCERDSRAPKAMLKQRDCLREFPVHSPHGKSFDETGWST
jgi:hypothetical protein